MKPTRADEGRSGECVSVGVGEWVSVGGRGGGGGGGGAAGDLTNNASTRTVCRPE